MKYSLSLQKRKWSEKQQAYRVTLYITNSKVMKPWFYRFNYKGEAVFATKKEWALYKSGKTSKFCKWLKEVEMEVITKARDILVEMQDWNKERFIAEYEGVVKPKSDLIGMFQRRIMELEKQQKRGNMEVYQQAMNMLLQFQEEIPLFSITPDWLQRLEDWMLRTKGYSRNTVSIRQRTIRAVYYIAKKKNYVTASQNPFENFTLMGKEVRHKHFDKKYLVNLYQWHINLKDDHSQLAYALDWWIFRFFTGGMDLVDCLRLKWENLTESTVTFVRHKTNKKKGGGQPVTLALTDASKAIISKWGEFCNINSSPYIHHWIDPKWSEMKLSKKLANKRQSMQKCLNTLGNKIGIKKITNGSARDMFALVMSEQDTSFDRINTLMGRKAGSLAIEHYLPNRGEKSELEEKLLIPLQQAGERQTDS